MKLKKFSKKKSLLGISLFNFLVWRESRVFSSSGLFYEKQKFLNESIGFRKNTDLTIQEELLCIQNFMGKNLDLCTVNNSLPKKKNNSSVNSVYQRFMNEFTTNDSVVKNVEVKNGIMHHFFPHKKAFMHYWIWPFIGLAGYVFLTKNFISSSRTYKFNLDNQYFEKKSNFTDTKKMIDHHRDLDFHTYKITSFKDQRFGRLFSKMNALEKDEFDNLWQFSFFEKKEQIRNCIYSSYIPINTKRLNAYNPFILWHSLKHQNSDEFPNKMVPFNNTFVMKDRATYQFPITSYKNASYKMDNLFKTSILYGQHDQQEFFKKNAVINALQSNQSNLLKNMNLILNHSNVFGKKSINLKNMDLLRFKEFYDLSSNLNHKMHQTLKRKYLIKHVSISLKTAKMNHKKEISFFPVLKDSQNLSLESSMKKDTFVITNTNKFTNPNQNLLNLYKPFQWLHFYHIFSKNGFTECINKALLDPSIHNKQEKYRYEWLASKYSIETKKRIFEFLFLRFLTNQINQQGLKISKKGLTYKNDFNPLNRKWIFKQNHKKKKFFTICGIHEKTFHARSKKKILKVDKKQNISEFLNQTHMFLKNKGTHHFKIDPFKSLVDTGVDQFQLFFPESLNVALIPSLVSSQNRIAVLKLEQPIRMSFHKNEELSVFSYKDDKSSISSKQKKDIDLGLSQKEHSDLFQNPKTKFSFYLTTNSSLFSPFLDRVKTARNVDQSFFIKSNYFHFNIFNIQNTYNILRVLTMSDLFEKFQNFEKLLEKYLLKSMTLLKNHQIFLIHQHDLSVDKNLNVIKQISNSCSSVFWLPVKETALDLKKISNLYTNSNDYLTLKPKTQYQFLMRKNLFNHNQDKIFRTYLNSKFHKRKQKKIHPPKFFFLNQNLKSKCHLSLTNDSRSKYLQKSLSHLKNHVKKQSHILKKSSPDLFFGCHFPMGKKLSFEHSPMRKIKVFELENQIHNQSVIKEKIQNHLNISANTLLRRIGFLFVYKSEKVNVDTINRLDKQRSLQKKRRRKKRKRFYPRPIWLRFLLYKNFLVNRYFSYKKWFHYEKNDLKISIKNKKNQEIPIMNVRKSDYHQTFKQHSIPNSINKDRYLNLKMSKNRLNASVKKRFFSKTFKKHKKINKEIYRMQNSNLIYRNHKQQWDNGFQNNTKNEKSICQKASFLWTFPNFNNHKYYSISNSILNDFQKSRLYWSRSSLIAYIKRIEDSFKKMRMIETNSPAQQSNFVETFVKSRFFLNENKNFSNPLNVNEQKKFPLSWYLNLKNTFLNDDLTSNSFLFNRLHDNAEYSRILYEKNSQDIQNSKFMINHSISTMNSTTFKNDEQKEFKNHYGDHRRGKLEKPFNPSFWEGIALSMNRTFHSSKIRASRFESLADPSLKPYGDLPTLRTLWALNRSNLLSNLSESMSGSFVETKALWGHLKSRDQKKQSISNKFFYSSWNHVFPKSLKKLSVLKLEIVHKKLRYAGFGWNDQKAYLRYLKQDFRNLFHHFYHSPSSPHPKVHEAIKGRQNFNHFLNEKPPIHIEMQPQKHPKRTIHFWWSRESFYGFGTTNANWFLSEWKDNEFSHLVMDQTYVKSIFQQSRHFDTLKASHKVKEQNHEKWTQYFEKMKIPVVENATLTNFGLTCFFSCSLLFHICSLFGLIQISEIRSFTKFLILILYKFSNCYFIMIYSIFSSIKESFKQLKFNLKGINLSKHSNRSFHFFSSLTSTIKNKKKNVRFLLKKVNHLKNYEMIYTLGKYEQISYDQKSDKNFIKNLSYHTKTYLNTYYKINPTNHKIQEKSILLEMCFYLPNLKTFFDQKISFFDWSKSIHIKNQYYKFKDAENWIFSFPKNFKNLSYTLSNHFTFHHSNLQKDKIQYLNAYITKIQNQFWLFILYMTKSSILSLYGCIGFFSAILFKIIDILESLMLMIYTFLEKPAEFMIEWIAQIFLIEWSSDVTRFIPESFDIYTWRSYTKLARGSRAFGIFGWFIQRRLSCFFEMFMDLSTKPDSDLMNRQKKGMIFWDIWAEILMIAAQKYQINISSLISLKEEQETFLERLLDDPNWFSMKYPIKKSLKNIRNEKSNDNQMFLNLKQNHSKNINIDIRSNQVHGFSNFHRERKVSEINTTIEEKQSQALADLIVLTRMLQRPTSWWNAFFEMNSSNGISIDYEKFHLSKSHFILRNSSLDAFSSKNGFSAPFSHANRHSRKHISHHSVNTKTPLLAENIDVFYAFIEKFQNQADIRFENHLNQPKEIWRRWSANPFFSDKNMDTDLFIDIHPPKSFNQLTVFQGYVNPNSFIIPTSEKLKFEFIRRSKSTNTKKRTLTKEKNSNKLTKDLQNSETCSPMISGSGLHALGSLTCQIYSGLFSKQIAKNILVIGEAGNRQNLLIYALAGETELKMITDNAHRYGHIQRGVAVGMKLLRDVFEGLVLHTPCLFLIEDIHVIGERRPMPNPDSIFPKGSGPTSVLEEVHEKNQLIYQLNKHVISDFKKPYKGDFSLFLPTNHFCFDLFLGVSPPKIRKVGLSSRNPFSSINDLLSKDSKTISKKSSVISYKSILQVPSHQIFAPPATSPFTLLGLKEQRKFKPNKMVKQIPWGGFSSGHEADQMISIPKVMYSVRAKIAFLADMAINQLGVKLDMITDLLVIMDNVRSNRGFVVFATTHLPFVLDPALRRPGRFDETISLSLLPTFMNRIEILKTHLSHYSSTFECFDYSFFIQNLNETDLSNLISRAKLLLFHHYKILNLSNWRKTFYPISENVHKTHNSISHQNVIFSVNQAMKFLTHQTFIEPKKRLFKYDSDFSSMSPSPCLMDSSKIQKNEVSLLNLLKNVSNLNDKFPSSSTMLSLTYSQIGKFIIQSRILNDNRCFRLIANFRSFHMLESTLNLNMFTNLYYPSFDVQNHLMYLLSEKMGEFFISNNSFVLKKPTFSTFIKPNHFLLNYETILSSSILSSSILSSSKHKNMKVQTPSLRQYLTSPGDYSIKQNFSLNASDPFWSSATAFVFSFVQKRYLYHKNLLVSKLLYFNDISMQREPSSPPASSILMPAKKYENFKRTEFDFQQKRVNSILEKIQIHQQQRFMKHLYQKPVTEWFQSHSMKHKFTSFSHSIKELGYYDAFMKKPSSVNCYYKNRILNRQRFSMVNQWWNGQLAEHNLEKVFSSDVDWRSMFVESFGDLVIDFPDTEQYYNPKLRRWFLQSTYGGYWQTFEKNIPYEIYQHFMLLCFNKAFNQLDTEREILDNFAYYFLQKGFLKEIDLISNLSKFSISLTDNR